MIFYLFVCDITRRLRLPGNAKQLRSPLKSAFVPQFHFMLQGYLSFNNFDVSNRAEQPITLLHINPPTNKSKRLSGFSKVEIKTKSKVAHDDQGCCEKTSVWLSLLKRSVAVPAVSAVSLRRFRQRPAERRRFGKLGAVEDK